MPLLPQVEYNQWAREVLDGVEIPIGASGLPPMPEGTVEFDYERLDPAQIDGHVFQECRRRVAERMQTDPEKVVITNGCSHANFLAAAGLMNYGERLAVEFPYYQQLKRLAGVFNPEPVALDLRKEGGGWEYDRESFRQAITANADMLMCSSPNNPTGAVLDRDTAHAAGEIGRRHDAWIVVDEIYAEFLNDDFQGTIQEEHPQIIATGGLNKIAGLYSLRFGWVIAEPETAEWIRNMVHINVLGLNTVTPQLALQVYDNYDAVLERAERESSPEKRALVADFVETREELSWHEPEYGLVGFVKLDHPNLTVNELSETLIEEHDCGIVPGRFFGKSDHFRLGWSLPEDQVEKGLNCIAEALDYA